MTKRTIDIPDGEYCTGCPMYTRTLAYNYLYLDSCFLYRTGLVVSPHDSTRKCSACLAEDEGRADA